MDLRIEKNNTETKKAIVGAIAFFDMFDFPLTDFEVWKFISVKCNLSEIQEVLTSMSLRAEGEAIPVSASDEVATLPSVARNDNRGMVKKKNGFYFLRGRNEIINKRLKRYAYADRKFKRVMRVVKIFKFIPWIKMIAVSNIIGAHNLRDGSDIDLFIITKAKKIWLTRFFCSSIAQVLGLRPKKGDERDKICLNFYISEEALDISRLMLNSGHETARDSIASLQNDSVKDIYFRYWLVSLIPIYDTGGLYKKFIKENNWIKNYFPNWQSVQIERRRYVSGDCSRFNILSLFNGLENQFKKLQLKLMPEYMKEMTNKDTRVVISDKVLKLHINDRREEYRDRFNSKITFLSF